MDILRKNIDNENVDYIEKEIKNYIKERFDVICQKQNMITKKLNLINMKL